MEINRVHRVWQLIGDNRITLRYSVNLGDLFEFSSKKVQVIFSGEQQCVGCLVSLQQFQDMQECDFLDDEFRWFHEDTPLASVLEEHSRTIPAICLCQGRRGGVLFQSGVTSLQLRVIRPLSTSNAAYQCVLLPLWFDPLVLEFLLRVIFDISRAECFTIKGRGGQVCRVFNMWPGSGMRNEAQDDSVLCLRPYARFDLVIELDTPQDNVNKSFGQRFRDLFCCPT